MRRYTPPTATLVPQHAECMFKGVIYDVYQWQQEQFDGSFKTFEMIKRPDSVNIVAVHEEKILISEEEQPYIGEFIALPAGMHDVPEEDELQAAKRELREETGYVFKNWKLINTQQNSERVEQIRYTFLATDLVEIVSPETDAGGEKIEPKLMTFEAFTAMKFHPKTSHYPWYIFDTVRSLDELLALPALYDYENSN